MISSRGSWPRRSCASASAWPLGRVQRMAAVATLPGLAHLRACAPATTRSSRAPRPSRRRRPPSSSSFPSTHTSSAFGSQQRPAPPCPKSLLPLRHLPSSWGSDSGRFVSIRSANMGPVCRPPPVAIPGLGLAVGLHRCHGVRSAVGDRRPGNGRRRPAR